MTDRQLASLATLVALALALCLPFASRASTTESGPPPSVTVEVDGHSYQVPLEPIPGTDRLAIPAREWVDEEEYEVRLLNGTLDPDPSIAYGIAVTDFGAPSNFSFVFTTPIVPTAAPTVVDASISGGLTDQTGNGVTISPTLLDLDGDGTPEVQIAEVDDGIPTTTNMGVDVGPLQAYPAGPAGANHVYQFSAGPQAGPGGGPYDTLRVRLAFGLTGGGDIASLTGFAQVNTIPEPSSLLLLGLGACGVAYTIRRRRARG
jgi:hypothetical protein